MAWKPGQRVGGIGRIHHLGGMGLNLVGVTLLYGSGSDRQNGDGAECSFWITPSDRAARDFSRVCGTIEGH